MDPLSIFTLITVCVQATASLYQTIDDSKSRKQDVQHLKIEIGDLNIVLKALQKNLEESTENFEVLRLILERCGQACKEFETKVLDLLKESGSSVKQIKAWTKLQFLGGDINNFRKLIGSYKATVTIALADYNLKSTRVTQQLIEQYAELTKDTASDLEEQITELSEKLEALESAPADRSIDSMDADSKTDSLIAKQTLDQKAGLEQCLLVCQQLLNHIKKLRLLVSGGPGSMKRAMDTQDAAEGADILAPRLTADTLRICLHSVGATAQQLQELGGGSQSPNTSFKAQVEHQLAGARQCLDVVETAQQRRINSFENIAIGDDSFQTVVSTMGALIRANGLTIGARSFNMMGQMNDESLQAAVNNFGVRAPRNPLPNKTHAGFEERHGFGRTINGSRQ
ncbi:uncharacterized protein Z519_05079 [Cladophialophora bantiana CBS 173.52]|uniref:Azaphilone pigments biosynthesis cluster protein L N-terminal domain-containing protein n=1 Tax=Cladophialophora bantiana (strain ATCC 10958 / CBS 173.52 / CDC B-1940 / NIH 8579) TaxID=1442370 RepID=A0A0D2IAE0_CLAB1|nr:uncharacterized protein Z519_05079 [Cladophialophora bantiana CBS 173.52]KIW93764.1 hypothetical protein Z519_05079 [Cladophialophora bantiana CBS 173.52]